MASAWVRMNVLGAIVLYRCDACWEGPGDFTIDDEASLRLCYKQ